MTFLYNHPFQPIRGSSAPAFESTLGSTSQFYALESTAIGRTWDGPFSRSIRLCESSGVDYYVSLGSTTAVAASSDSQLMLGGTVEILRIQPGQTHIAIAGKSTDVQVNVTLGTGQ